MLGSVSRMGGVRVLADIVNATTPGLQCLHAGRSSCMKHGIPA